MRVIVANCTCYVPSKYALLVGARGAIGVGGNGIKREECGVVVVCHGMQRYQLGPAAWGNQE